MKASSTKVSPAVGCIVLLVLFAGCYACAGCPDLSGPAPRSTPRVERPPSLPSPPTLITGVGGGLEYIFLDKGLHTFYIMLEQPTADSFVVVVKNTDGKAQWLELLVSETLVPSSYTVVNAATVPYTGQYKLSVVCGPQAIWSVEWDYY